MSRTSLPRRSSKQRVTSTQHASRVTRHGLLAIRPPLVPANLKNFSKRVKKFLGVPWGGCLRTEKEMVIVHRLGWRDERGLDGVPIVPKGFQLSDRAEQFVLREIGNRVRHPISLEPVQEALQRLAFIRRQIRPKGKLDRTLVWTAIDRVK